MEGSIIVSLLVVRREARDQGPLAPQPACHMNEYRGRGPDTSWTEPYSPGSTLAPAAE